ncbi:MAG: hypothetical protein II527_05255 [Bacteroidales bacterium]|nr:hypothetical protein [Bacteroidales bacterium]
MKRSLRPITALVLSAVLTAVSVYGQGIVHPKPGTSFSSERIKVTFRTRKQQFNFRDTATLDTDINSPKSVNIHPSGEKYYVNSLEGGKTAVYDFATGKKLKVIDHTFTSAHKALWAPASGLFHFRHEYKSPDSFMGKPVESTFSHRGRYLWIPYYRRSYDINAQEPSAMAVIDTRKDSIIRIFETGPLPKMVATSHDGKLLAVTHWGDNTVGLMDISSQKPEEWKYIACLVVDYKLNLNFSLTQKVDRDVNSGYCLRGTVFTEDGRYLLVGCMGGSGGIAVIDLEQRKYLGRAVGIMSNLRHLLIKDGILYVSINKYGYVLRMPVDTFLGKVRTLDGDKVKTVAVTGFQQCKVPAGARTINISPKGDYIFAACNSSSCLAIVDAVAMKLIGTLPADSYPVGLDISDDGRFLFTTSQGRSNGGGNAVDIFEVEYRQP